MLKGMYGPYGWGADEQCASGARGLCAEMVKGQKGSGCMLVHLTSHSAVCAPRRACHPVCIEQGQSESGVPGVEVNLRRACRIRAGGGCPAAGRCL